MRRLDVLVRDQDDLDLDTGLELRNLGALLVEQVGCHLDRYLGVDGGGALLHRLLLDHAQHVQCRRLDVSDHAGAVAARAGDVRTLVQRRAQSLARQLHQAESGDLARLDPGAVVMQGVLDALLDLTLVLGVLHVDEVDDDQAAEVAQPHLARGFLGRLEVRSERRVLDVGAAGGARRVDVDRDQGLGVVDHDGTARGQRHEPRVRGLDLVLDLEAREQRRRVLVTLDPSDGVRHHVTHELPGLLVDVVGIDQDLADVRREVVADRADDQARFLVDQERASRGACRAVDRTPELHQVVQVPLQFFLRATDAGSAGDQAHARGQVEPVHDLAEFLPVLALDAARHTAAARVVRHQDQVTPGQ